MNTFSQIMKADATHKIPASSSDQEVCATNSFTSREDLLVAGTITRMLKRSFVRKSCNDDSITKKKCITRLSHEVGWNTPMLLHLHHTWLSLSS